MKPICTKTLLILFFLEALTACGGKDSDPGSSDLGSAGAPTTDGTVTGGTGGTGGGSVRAGGGGTVAIGGSGSVSAGGGAGGGGSSANGGSGSTTSAGGGSSATSGGAGNTGNTTSAGGGSSANGGSGSTTSAGGATVIEECQFDPDEDIVNIILPQAITFSVKNTRSTPLYVRTPANCAPWLTLYSCADNLKSVMAHTSACTLSCATEGDRCVHCAPCLDSYEELAPAATTAYGWNGKYYEFVPAGACKCHELLTAPEGKYRAAIEVYGSDELSEANVPTTVTVDFMYPDADGIIEVNL